jgi:Protein phosphatase 2C
VWIIDGATDLGEPGLVGARGGAAWIAAAADRALAAADDAPLSAIVAAMFGAVAQAFNAARTRKSAGAWELPSASFLAIRVEDGRLDCAWLGDCAGFHIGAGVVVRIGPQPVEKDSEAALASSFVDQDPARLVKAAPVLAELRNGRSRSGRHILGVDPAMAAHVHHATRPCCAGDDIVLMTDGFAALFDRYAPDSAQSLSAALHCEGLHGLAVHLRAAETDDATCTRWPRFKGSDDATAIWVRIAD